MNDMQIFEAMLKRTDIPYFIERHERTTAYLITNSATYTVYHMFDNVTGSLIQIGAWSKR